MKRHLKSRIFAFVLVLFTAFSSMHLDVHAEDAFAPITENSTRGFVTRMYSVVLGRQPDIDGYNYWVEELNSGRRCASDLVYGFFFSEEYVSKNKSSDEIVTDFYNAMLNRAPDEAGFADWKKRIDVGCSMQVLNAGFVNSVEFNEICNFYGIQSGQVACTAYRDQNYERTYFVYRLYKNCLERTPDSEGLEDWCRALATGQSGSGAAYGFIFSNEYTSKNTSYGEYVEMLYRTMLGREPDEAGKESWVQQLRDGASREAILNGFLFSQEFTNQCQVAGINVGERVEEPSEPLHHTCTRDNGRVTKEPSCSCEGEKEYHCAVCDRLMDTEVIDKTPHQMAWVTTRKATTKSYGMKVYKCKVCGFLSTTEIIPKIETPSTSKTEEPTNTPDPTPAPTPKPVHQHNYVLSKSVAADCTTDGYKKYICKGCGDVKEETTPALGHSYQWVTTKKATADEDGIKVHKCSVCGKVDDTKTIPKLNPTPDPTQNPTEPAHQHEYRVLSSKTATCTVAGYKEYICSSCGDKYKEEIPALGHDYYMSDEMKANCSHPGRQWYTCTRCNHEYNIVSEPQLEHDWVYTKTPATCTKDGELYKECSRCKSSSRTTIPKLGHNYQYTKTIEPTYTEGGADIYTCQNCGDTIEKNCTPKKEHEHSYQWVVVKQPTAEKDGLREYTCSLCGDVESSEVIQKNASGCLHPYPRDFEVTTPATCCSYAIGKIICKECGEVLNAEYENEGRGYDANNHTHFTESVVKAATYKEAGTRKYTCDGCGYSYTEDIPKLVCDHSKTCIACKPNSDETWKKCELCGEYLEQVQMSDEPCTHSGCGLVEIERVPVSETQAGVYDYACERCGHVFSTYTLHPYKTYTVTFADGHTQTVYGWFDSEYANCEYGKEVLALTNEYRKENGLNELHYNSTLQWASNQRALEASVHWTHDRPDGTKWSTVTAEWKYGGENLASGHATPSEAMKGWKNSPEHNHALLFGKADGEMPFKGVSVGAFHKYLFNNTSQPHTPTEYVVWAQNFTFYEY